MHLSKMRRQTKKEENTGIKKQKGVMSVKMAKQGILEINLSNKKKNSQKFLEATLFEFGI